MVNRFIFGIVTLVLFLGCTKDDICGEDTPTTPLLVIDFRDINDRLASKSVESLLVYLNDIDSTRVFSSAVNDTIISIPLNTEANSTSFLFEIHSDNEEESNFDTITFHYTPEEIYINRACGFKVNFTDLFVALTEEPLNENWILDYEILNPSITNNNEAHLTIYH